MRLQKLRLENFQGIDALDIVTNDKDLEIRGANATGKTTVANAITWLLFDKASTGEKGYTPKTVDENGEDVHNLNHSVEGVFTDGGKRIVFKKTMREDWKQKRGSNVKEFSGHLIDYFIDGVPVKQKEFRAALDAICDPDRAKILTIPEYFANDLHWKERRNILLEVCGDVSDEDVISAHAELETLQYYLLKTGSNEYYTVEEYLKIANAKKAEINSELQLIPARIDEAKKAKPDVDGLDVERITAEIMDLYAQKAALEGRLSAVDVSGEASELRVQLADARSGLGEAKALFMEAQNKRNESIEQERMKYQAMQLDIGHQIAVGKAAVSDLSNTVREMKAMRQRLIDRYSEEKAKQFTFDETCPTCGQAIPADKIEEAREQFNKAQAEKLEAINHEGKEKCDKNAIALKQADLEAAIAKLDGLQKQYIDMDALIDGCTEKMDRSKFEDSVEYKAITSAITAIQAKIDGESHSDQKEAIREEIRAVQSKINEKEGLKLNIRYAKAQDERIEQLMAREKELSGEYERVQQGVYLSERFITLKSEMLTEAINSKFKAVRFKLFDVQINGGIADTCEVLVPCHGGLVPFGTANNAGRVNAGLEIIDTLGKHWGVDLPIVIDNAESVIKLMDTSAQKIKMYVDERYDKLHVEV